MFNVDSAKKVLFENDITMLSSQKQEFGGTLETGRTLLRRLKIMPEHDLDNMCVVRNQKLKIFTNFLMEF